MLCLATGGRYREGRDHGSAEAERDAVGERLVDVGIAHSIRVGVADRRTSARRIGILPDGSREHGVEVLPLACRRHSGSEGHHVEGHEDVVVHPGPVVIERERHADAQRVGIGVGVEEGEGERLPERVGVPRPRNRLREARCERRPAPAL